MPISVYTYFCCSVTIASDSVSIPTSNGRSIFILGIHKYRILWSRCWHGHRSDNSQHFHLSNVPPFLLDVIIKLQSKLHVDRNTSGLLHRACCFEPCCIERPPFLVVMPQAILDIVLTCRRIATETWNAVVGYGKPDA